MTVHLQNEIELLKKRILTLGAEVEEALQKSIRAFKNCDTELARAIEAYDEEIDRKEVETEEECLKILALHQPVAIDLRFVIAVLKINNDLERIADLAANLANRTQDMGCKRRVEMPPHLMTMVDQAESMLKRSLDALVNMNPELAHQVIIDDDIVDELHRKTYQFVHSELKKNPGEAESLISILTVSRQVERIADSVTNIAEDIIYMVDGEIVRHRI